MSLINDPLSRPTTAPGIGAFQKILSQRPRRQLIDDAPSGSVYSLLRVVSITSIPNELLDALIDPREVGGGSTPPDGNWNCDITPKERLNKLKHLLSFNERTVLELRFGLCDDGYRYSRSEVARILLTTPEQIRLTETKATITLQRFARRSKAIAYVSYRLHTMLNRRVAQRVRAVRGPRLTGLDRTN